jgi:cytochrome c-type biogenesis protein CcmH
VTPAQIEAMVQKLADRLKNNPNDLQGWYMLARSLATLQRLPEALQALDTALKLAPNEPQLLADYADISATINGGNLEGKPTELIQKALQIDPKNSKALALAGTAAFRKKDYARATEYWTTLKGVLSESGAPQDQIAMVESNINEARGAQGLPPLPPSAAATAQPPMIAAGAPPMMTSGASNGSGAKSAGPDQKITVSVSLSPTLAAKAAPGDTLFIFARAVNGPRMPLAIIRTTASELPKTFTLDDSLAMSPMMKISDFPEVMVGARISKSGNAMPQSGDLMTTTGPVKVGTQNAKLVIDTVTQ